MSYNFVWMISSETSRSVGAGLKGILSKFLVDGLWISQLNKSYFHNTAGYLIRTAFPCGVYEINFEKRFTTSVLWAYLIKYSSSCAIRRISHVNKRTLISGVKVRTQIPSNYLFDAFNCFVFRSLELFIQILSIYLHQRANTEVGEIFE